MKSRKEPEKIEKLVKPSFAGEILSVTRRTLKRYEVSGKLNPIKINSRVTRYRLSEVMALANPLGSN